MNPHGNGLGLSICHKIAEKLKGNLTCKSGQEIGSVFEFTFEAKLIRGKSKKLKVK